MNIEKLLQRWNGKIDQAVLPELKEVLLDYQIEVERLTASYRQALEVIENLKLEKP